MATDIQPFGSLELDVEATPDRLADIRRQLAAWLAPIGLSDTSAADIVLVVNEACTNSIEHAYRDGTPGRINLEARLEGSQIVVCIADFGVWKTPPRHSTTRGRGMPIMDAVSAHVDVEHTASGTTVRITFDAA